MAKQRAARLGGPARPEKSPEVQAALDQLSAIFWRAAIAELDAEMDRDEAARKRTRRSKNRAEARL